MNATSNITLSALTILQAEECIQSALEGLRAPAINASLPQALPFLTPVGFRPVVELHAPDRKKRRTASADSWSPTTDEIRIYFEPVSVPAPKQSPPSVTARQSAPPADLIPQQVSNAPDPVSELCDTLEEVERAGRAFIALKWFRDEALAGKDFAWARTAEERQTILAKAIEAGSVLTGRIPNPKSPMHPTTTIRLNRSAPTPQGSVRRYNPVKIKGESLSTTILRDRGPR